MTQHRHHDLIVQWAANTSLKVETRVCSMGKWEETRNPQWVDDQEYRIKPRTKKVKYCAFEFSDGCVTWSREGSASYHGRMDNEMNRIPELDKEVELCTD